MFTCIIWWNDAVGRHSIAVIAAMAIHRTRVLNDVDCDRQSHVRSPSIEREVRCVGSNGSSRGAPDGINCRVETWGRVNVIARTVLSFVTRDFSIVVMIYGRYYCRRWSQIYYRHTAMSYKTSVLYDLRYLLSYSIRVETQKITTNIRSKFFQVFWRILFFAYIWLHICVLFYVLLWRNKLRTQVSD